MPVQTPQDLFLLELSDTYNGAQLSAQASKLYADEDNEPQAKQVFQEHERMIRQQIGNLQQCFQLLGAQPQAVECSAVKGLVDEHNRFVSQQSPTREVHSLFDLSANFKNAEFNRAGYHGLAEKARLMGQQQAAQLLEENVRLEEQAAQRVDQLGQQLEQQAIQRTRRAI